MKQGITTTKWSIDINGYLLLEIHSRQWDHTAHNRIDHECVVIHQFIRRERRHRVQEILCCFREISRSHTIKTFIHFETITTIPVTSLLNEAIHRIEKDMTHQHKKDRMANSQMAGTAVNSESTGNMHVMLHFSRYTNTTFSPYDVVLDLTLNNSVYSIPVTSQCNGDVC